MVRPQSPDIMYICYGLEVDVSLSHLETFITATVARLTAAARVPAALTRCRSVKDEQRQADEECQGPTA